MLEVVLSHDVEIPLDRASLGERDLRRLLHIGDIDENIVEEAEPPFIDFRRRDGVPRRDQNDGERPVAISEDLADILQGRPQDSPRRIHPTDLRGPIPPLLRGGVSSLACARSRS